MLVCWDPVGTLGARPTECFISRWFTVNAPGTRIHPVECCTLKDGKTRKCRTKDRERKDPKIVLISPFTSSSDISVNPFKAVLFQRLVFFANMGQYAFFQPFCIMYTMVRLASALLLMIEKHSHVILSVSASE